MPNWNKEQNRTSNIRQSTSAMKKMNYNVITLFANATGHPKQAGVFIEISLSSLKIEHHNMQQGIQPKVQIEGDEHNKIIFIILKEAVSISHLQVTDYPSDSKVTVSHLEYTCTKDLIAHLGENLQVIGSLICRGKFVPKPMIYTMDIKEPWNTRCIDNIVKQHIHEKRLKPTLPYKVDKSTVYSNAVEAFKPRNNQISTSKVERGRMPDCTARDPKIDLSVNARPQAREDLAQNKLRELKSQSPIIQTNHLRLINESKLPKLGYNKYSSGSQRFELTNPKTETNSRNRPYNADDYFEKNQARRILETENMGKKEFSGALVSKSMKKVEKGIATDERILEELEDIKEKTEKERKYIEEQRRQEADRQKRVKMEAEELRRKEERRQLEQQRREREEKRRKEEQELEELKKQRIERERIQELERKRQLAAEEARQKEEELRKQKKREELVRKIELERQRKIEEEEERRKRRESQERIDREEQRRVQREIEERKRRAEEEENLRKLKEEQRQKAIREAEEAKKKRKMEIEKEEEEARRKDEEQRKQRETEEQRKQIEKEKEKERKKEEERQVELQKQEVERAKRLREGQIRQELERQRQKEVEEARRKEEKKRELEEMKKLKEERELAHINEIIKTMEEKEEKTRIQVEEQIQRQREIEDRNKQAEEEEKAGKLKEERVREAQRQAEEAERKKMEMEREERMRQDGEQKQKSERQRQKEAEEEAERKKQAEKEKEEARRKDEEQRRLKKEEEEKEKERQREAEERNKRAQEGEKIRKLQEERVYEAQRKAEEAERKAKREMEEARNKEAEKEKRRISEQTQARQKENSQPLSDMTNSQSKQMKDNLEQTRLLQSKSSNLKDHYNPKQHSLHQGLSISTSSTLEKENKISPRALTRNNSDCSILSLYDPFQPQGYGGLYNMGNTCFMNSILQNLCNIQMFANYFLKDKHLNHMNLDSERGEFALLFGEIIKGIKTKGSIHAIMDLVKHLLKKLEKITCDFNEAGQNDALQFLKALLDTINTEISRVKGKPPYETLTVDPKNLQASSDKWFKYMLSRENSIVTDLFCGQLLNKTTCSNGHEKLSFDNFWDLPLAFKNKTRSSRLEEMLASFLAEEQVMDTTYCEKCKGENKFKMQQVLWKLPRILVIHFKRFECFGDDFRKVDTAVTFPVDNLNLGHFITESKDPSTQDSMYTLCGIVHHYGSLNSGHYTAQCKIQQEKGWRIFNDSHFSDKHDLGREETSRSAYILFYVKSSLVNRA